ncbi:hypothetical protein DFS34DRAFT_223224 [Phlyctochytrium arcticum]|nr:hypothetical protein DFS34DRAFT_223224 [Phlyctochytrium arcticum]
MCMKLCSPQLMRSHTSSPSVTRLLFSAHQSAHLDTMFRYHVVLSFDVIEDVPSTIMAFANNSGSFSLPATFVGSSIAGILATCPLSFPPMYSRFGVLHSHIGHPTQFHFTPMMKLAFSPSSPSSNLPTPLGKLRCVAIRPNPCYPLSALHHSSVSISQPPNCNPVSSSTVTVILA